MPAQRPLGVTILAILFVIFFLLEVSNVILSFLHYFQGSGLIASPLTITYNIALSIISILLAYGLLKGGKKWSWYLALAFITIDGLYLVITSLIKIAMPNELGAAVLAAIILCLLDYYLTRPNVKDWLTKKPTVTTKTSHVQNTTKINSGLWIVSGILGTCSLLTIILLGFHLSALQMNQIENYEIIQAHSNPLGLGGTNLPFQQQMNQLNGLTETFTLGYILLSGVVAIITYYLLIRNSKGPPKPAFVALFTFTACGAASFVLGLIATYFYFKRANWL
jgi:hypothetical protein